MVARMGMLITALAGSHPHTEATRSGITMAEHPAFPSFDDQHSPVAAVIHIIGSQRTIRAQGAPVMSIRTFVVASILWTLISPWLPGVACAREISVNARSAILVDMTNGQVLYEQNADMPIAPASITKVLTLYLVFEAIREGRLHLWDNVTVSARAAKTGGSRMGLRTGDIVPVGELVKGAAVVSGNDACVALAEHMSGSVEAFVRQMNVKARQLGMNDSTFLTPNGLPARGQLTTARDISRLSVAYLRRYPESLNIHSMQSYTYRTTTHRNANRLLGTCQGVDGLKTGFVCAAGYNLTATAVRGDHRLVAVVLGAPSPGVRAAETARLLDLGYDSLGTGTVLVRAIDDSGSSCPVTRGSSQTVRKAGGKGRKAGRTVAAATPAPVPVKARMARSASKPIAPTVGSDSVGSATSRSKTRTSVASRKGQPPTSASAARSDTRSTRVSAKSVEPKASTAGKAQIAGRSPEPSRSQAVPKTSKATGARSASIEKAASASKEKAASSPPAIRKISPIPKTPPRTAELAKPRS